jgi:hypothetical protein
VRGEALADAGPLSRIAEALGVTADARLKKPPNQGSGGSAFLHYRTKRVEQPFDGAVPKAFTVSEVAKLLDRDYRRIRQRCIEHDIEIGIGEELRILDEGDVQKIGKLLENFR